MLTKTQAAALELVPEGGHIAMRPHMTRVTRHRTHEEARPFAIGRDGRQVGEINGRTLTALWVYRFIEPISDRLDAEEWAITERGREALDRYRLRAS